MSTEGAGLLPSKGGDALVFFAFGAIARGLFVVAGDDAMRGFRKTCLADETTTVAAVAEEDNCDCTEAMLGGAGVFREKTQCNVGADPSLN